jgi:cell division protein ZapA (FtsZ GTPase activity inhibitor)
VESFLEQQISTIQQSSSSISSSNLYLLVALNLADQLMRQKQQPQYDEMEKNLRDLCERLDQVLVQA